MGQSKNTIFVYAENKTRDVALELLSASMNLSPKTVCAVYLGAERLKNAESQKLFEAGADIIYEIIHEKLSTFNSLYFSRAIIDFVSQKQPDIMLFGATNQGRELAPRVSSALSTGLTADCTKLEIVNYNGEAKLASTRPTFGGSLLATILCKTKPQMATVREHVLKINRKPAKNTGLIEVFTPNLKDYSSGIKLMKSVKNESKNLDSLDDAKIILAGGLGLKSKENFEKLTELSSLLNCAIGASRGAVDKGFCKKDCQIGQTGKTVAPKIYVAFGISGAIHHLSGIENAEYVIAVNNDRNSPIFENCDYGILADANFVIDELINEIKKQKSIS